MKTLLLAGVTAFALSCILGFITIPFLKKLKAGQPIYEYVKEHKEKDGTPTMGGLFFIVAAVITFILFGGANSRIAVVSASIGVAYMLVGFIDDFIKIKYKTNEGLRPYQKIIFQLFIAVFAGVFVWHNGITVFYLPFASKSVDLGLFAMIIVPVIFLAITNSVNLTDGLDGLSGSVSVAYLISFICLIAVQIEKFEALYLLPAEYEYLKILSVSLVGAILGFLVFNHSKAKVFMGDTGSLSLGGFIGAISVFSSNSFFIPIIGIMFVLSSISVILQVAYFKRTKKRIFLMAPLHHHFQLKGYSENKIAYCYTIITFIAGIICLITYM